MEHKGDFFYFLLFFNEVVHPLLSNFVYQLVTHQEFYVRDDRHNAVLVEEEKSRVELKSQRD